MRDRKSDVHRTIASRAAGRKLTKGEVVHHLNEDKTDNRKENLAIQPHGAHTSAHNRTRHVSRLRKALAMVKKGEKLY